MSERLERHTQRAFPPYAFVPGSGTPHPTGDPRGHSYTGEREEPPPWLPPEDWRSCEDYLWGVDLYNHGYLWEAHEAWEGLWHVSKHEPDMADFLQGLIQCAAAALKVTMKNAKGVARLTEAGTGRLERVSQAHAGDYMGLDVEAFVDAMREWAGSEPSENDSRPRIALRR